MTNVFIYHPDAAVLKLMNRVISRYFDTVRHTFRLFGSWNITEATAYLQKHCSLVDIAFLDYSLYENAAALSVCLRTVNRSASLIHIGTTETLVSALIYRPSAMMTDPTDAKKLTSITAQFDEIHRRLETNRFLSFRFEGEPMRIAYKNIEYFESSAKKVILHLDNKPTSYCFTAKLDQLEQQVPAFFLRCHQSYLVNMYRIRRMDVINKSFLLYSDDVVFISKRMLSAARQKYEAFMAR